MGINYVWRMLLLLQKSGIPNWRKMGTVTWHRGEPRLRDTQEQWERLGYRLAGWSVNRRDCITGTLRLLKLSSFISWPFLPVMWKLHPPLPVSLMIQERVGNAERRKRQEPITEAKERQVDMFLLTLAEASGELVPLSCFVWNGAGLAFPSHKICCGNQNC